MAVYILRFERQCPVYILLQHGAVDVGDAAVDKALDRRFEVRLQHRVQVRCLLPTPNQISSGVVFKLNTIWPTKITTHRCYYYLYEPIVW